MTVDSWQVEDRRSAGGSARSWPVASADDGKRTLHAMKRSFTFIFSIESTPSPASGLGGVSELRGWQDFGNFDSRRAF